MDYREIENRLARNQELIREREHDRLVEEIQNINKPQKRHWNVKWSWFVALFIWVESFRPKGHPRVSVENRTQFEQH